MFHFSSAPVNPPDNLQGLFTAYKAVLKWEVPDKLVFQGMNMLPILIYLLFNSLTLSLI